MNIRTVLVPLVLLALSGCFGKNAPIAPATSEPGYTFNLPQGWVDISQAVEVEDIRERIEDSDGLFDSMHTGSSSGGFQLPMLMFFRDTSGKLRPAEIRYNVERAEKFVADILGADGIGYSIMEKSYDDRSQRMFIDMEMQSERQFIRVQVVAFFTGEGTLYGVGYSSLHDARIGEIRQVLDSVRLSAKLQYK